MKYSKFLLIFFIINTTLIANNNLNLTIKEKAWLDSKAILTVGIDKNFAPFEFVDENGEFKGITADYLHEIEKILDRKFTIVKTKEWNEIVTMTKSNQIDILSCIVPTSQRDYYLNFTKPYLSFPMVIVTRKTTGFINGLSDLERKTVSVIEGYTPHQLLEKKHKAIHLVKTKNLEEALSLVASGKTFAHVGNLSRITYLLQKEGFQNLSISGIVEYKYNFSMGVKKNIPILRDILQKAFDTIPYKTKQDIYNKWFPIKYNQSTNYDLIITIALISTFIIVLFSLWMYKLKKEINRSKLIEHQLQKNAKWLNNSLKKANVGAWYWDLRTGTITGNSVYAKILGIDEEEVEIKARDFQKDFIEKDDLPMVMQELEDYFNKVVTTCSAEFRIHTKDGKTKMIRSNGEIFQYDSFNNPKVLFGFIKLIKVLD